MVISDTPNTQRNKNVTLQDIADQCRVSRALVSRVLRGDVRYASADTARRIRAAAQELGYDPSRHLAARRLVHSRRDVKVINNVIALYFPPRFYLSIYFTRLYEGVMQELSKFRYSALLDYSTPQTSDSLPNIFGRGDVDGVIVIAYPDVFLPYLKQLREEPNFGNRPIVSMMEQLPGSSYIGADDCNGGYLAASHLLELGHRQIFYQFPIKPSSIHSPRIEGCRKACLYNGLDPDKVLVKIPFNSNDEDFSENMLYDTLARYPDCSAIFAMNDWGANIIATTLRRAGKRIPEDYSLLGYDDVGSILDDEGKNILTTIRIPLQEAGRHAAEVCIKRITGELPEETTATFPVELIARGSTTPPPR